MAEPVVTEDERATEDALIFWIIERGAVDWLLEQHVRRAYDGRCDAYLCHRPWPCIWRERALEAQRRMRHGVTS